MEILGIFLGACVIITPFLLLAVDFIFFLKQKESFVFEVTAFLIAAVYMMLGYGVWDTREYSEALNQYTQPNVHEPFNSHYLWILVVLMLIGLICYLVLKFSREKLPPLVEVFLLSGVYLGCVINLLCVFQLFCGARPEGKHMGFVDVFCITALCSVPLIYFCHVVDLLLHLIRERAEKQETIQYENSFMQQINMWFLKGANQFWAALILMIPLLALFLMILCLFGQQPDSIVLAFTKTSDWVLSKEVAPPPLAVDEHYLCTVSLRGHKKLVKPIRCGIRRGQKIIVNRQLCVANAFEQLIMERTPRFHRALRSFYDTYGYPISKHISSAWRADITYLIMKPLEWFFVTVLYLFDTDPETRICKQYLPLP